jgi:integrase
MGVNTAIKATPVTEDEQDRFERFLRFEKWEQSQGRRPAARAASPAPVERTVGELHAEWLGTLGKVARKNRTSQGRHLKRAFRHQGVEYVLADLRPSECSPGHLEAWQRMLETTPSVLHKGKSIEAGTVHQIRMGIQSMWKYFIKVEELQVSPWQRVKKVAGRDRERKSYTTHQDTERWAEAMPQIGGYVVRHAFASGLRIMNQLRLQKTDVDYEAGGFNVVQKGDKEHFAPVDAKTLEEVRHLSALNPTSPWVYPNPRDPQRPIPYDTFLGWTRRARKKLGKHVVPHDLRHGCAMDMMDAGADIVEVKEQLGHSDIKLSTRYARIRGAAVKRLLDRQAKRLANR